MIRMVPKKYISDSGEHLPMVPPIKGSVTLRELFYKMPDHCRYAIVRPDHVKGDGCVYRVIDMWDLNKAYSQATWTDPLGQRTVEYMTGNYWDYSDLNTAIAATMLRI